MFEASVLSALLSSTLLQTKLVQKVHRLQIFKSEQSWLSRTTMHSLNQNNLIF